MLDGGTFQWVDYSNMGELVSGEPSSNNTSPPLVLPHSCFEYCRAFGGYFLEQWSELVQVLLISKRRVQELCLLPRFNLELVH